MIKNTGSKVNSDYTEHNQEEIAMSEYNSSEDMMSQPFDNLRTDRIETICAQFKLDLEQGTAPSIEKILKSVAEPVMPDLLYRLLIIEFRAKTTWNQPLLCSEYQARFPTLKPQVDEAWRVVHGNPDNRGQTDDAAPTSPDAPSSDNSVPHFVCGFEIVRILGSGGMGVVYHARQQGMINRDVALKLIRRDRLTNNASGDRFRARFRREADAIAAVSHPGVVQIYEARDCDGELYLAMELVKGTSLRRRLSDSGAFKPRDAAELVKRIAEAVAAVHQCGIIHRDLKPDNILLSLDGSPKVADFGLARLADSDENATGNHAILGTPGYMSPEQASGRSGEATVAVDIYGIGAVLYACLTGRPPFQSATTEDTRRHVIEREPLDPCKLNPSVPRDLGTICLKCLEKEPKHRYTAAQNVADDLTRFLAGVPVRARRVSVLERSWKWARRNPVIASLAATSAIVAAIGIGIGIEALRQRQARQVAEVVAGVQAERSQRLYDLRLVSQSLEMWRSAKPDQARKVLEQVPVSLRGWEWHHLDAMYGVRGVRQIESSPELATFFEFVDGGTSYVVPSDQKTIVHRQTDDGQEIRRFKLEDEIECIAIGREPSRLAVASCKGAIIVWDLKTGDQILKQQTPLKPFRVIFGSDSQRIALMDSNRSAARIFTFANGQSIDPQQTLPQPEGRKPDVVALSLDAELRRVAVVERLNHNPDSLMRQETATHTHKLTVLKCDTKEVLWSRFLSWSAAGVPPPFKGIPNWDEFLEEQSDDDENSNTQTIPVWVNDRLRFSLDGSFVIAKPPIGNACFFNALSGEPGVATERLAQGLLCPNDRLIAVPGEKGILVISEFATGRELAKLDCGDRITTNWRFRSDSQAIARCTNDAVVVFDLSSLITANRHSRVPSLGMFHRSHIAFSPDGKSYAILEGDESLTVYDNSSGHARRYLGCIVDSLQLDPKKRKSLDPREGIESPFRFSPNGRWLTTGPIVSLYSNNQSAMFLWDLELQDDPLVRLRRARHQSGFPSLSYQSLLPRREQWGDDGILRVIQRSKQGLVVQELDIASNVAASPQLLPDEPNVTAWSTSGDRRFFLGTIDGEAFLVEDGRRRSAWKAHQSGVEAITTDVVGGRVATASFFLSEVINSSVPHAGKQNRHQFKIIEQESLGQSPPVPMHEIPFDGRSSNYLPESVGSPPIFEGYSIEQDSADWPVSEGSLIFEGRPGYAEVPRKLSKLEPFFYSNESGSQAASIPDPEQRQIAPVVEWAVWGTNRDKPLARGKLIIPDFSFRGLNALRFHDGGRRLVIDASNQLKATDGLGSRLLSGAICFIDLDKKTLPSIWHFSPPNSDEGVEEGPLPSVYFRQPVLENEPAAISHIVDNGVCSALSPDGRMIAIGDSTGNVRVCETATGRELVRIAAHPNWAQAIVFAPGAKRLITSGREGSLRIWDLETGVEVLTLMAPGRTQIYGLRFSSNGRQLIGETFSEEDGIGYLIWNSSPAQAAP